MRYKTTIRMPQYITNFIKNIVGFLVISNLEATIKRRDLLKVVLKTRSRSATRLF